MFALLGPIFTQVLSLVGKYMDKAAYEAAMIHVNNIAKYGSDLDAWYAKPLDLQDDEEIPLLETKLQEEIQAFHNQLLVTPPKVA